MTDLYHETTPNDACGYCGGVHGDLQACEMPEVES